MTMDERERERERRGRFSRDECSVIATREGHGAPCQGIPASLSFSLPPSLLFHAQSKLAPNEALGSVHYRCIAAHPSIELFDAASKQPPLPSSSSFGIYIDEYDACPDSRVNLSLSLRFFFPLNGHRNFFPSRVEQVPFILPPAHLSTCRKGEAFRSDGGRGEEKKMSIGLSARRMEMDGDNARKSSAVNTRWRGKGRGEGNGFS